MDEIALFAIVRPPAPELTGPDRAALRDRLTAAVAVESANKARSGGMPSARPRSRLPGTAGGPGNLHPRWTRRRRLTITAVLAGATALAIAAVIALPAAGHGGRPSAAPSPGRGTGTAGSRASRAAPPIGPAPTTASAVLLLAAQVAARTPSLAPRPDQFVYTGQLVVGQTVTTCNGNNCHTVTLPPFQQRFWTSVNGEHAMYRIDRDLHSHKWVTNLGRTTPMCDAGPNGKPDDKLCEKAYDPNLPRTVRGMRSYLLRYEGPNGPVAFRILNGIGDNSWEPGFLVPNSSYALMFRAAAPVKGIHLVRHAVDVAGQPGIAVAACVPAEIAKGSMPGFHGCPQRIELIFAARSYELIGEYDVVTPGSSAMTFSPDYALLQIAIVNKLGELP
jgi:hypothetical protein